MLLLCCASWQEGYDLREQARWKLERATEMAVASKRWDAAGVSSFALAEMVGGDDALVAVGALMLHQVRPAKNKENNNKKTETNGKGHTLCTAVHACVHVRTYKKYIYIYIPGVFSASVCSCCNIGGGE